MDLLLRETLADVLRREVPAGLLHAPFMDREIPEEDPPVATLVVDQSPKARLVRAIQKHIRWYWWGKDEAVRAMDRYGAMTLEELNEPALLALLQRLDHLELCAQTGCDADEAVPAR